MKKIKLTEYIRKSAVQVSLSDSERERMKRVLLEYVAMKPMRNAPLDRRAPLSYMLLSLYAFSRKSVAGLLVFAILFSGASVSFAAEGALPGDALYPLKVDVNEPLVAALSVSPESKALWNAERAERRLEEAAKLASDDRLSDEVKEELEMRFEEHAERFAVDVERLEVSDSSVAADIATRFENKLLAHEVVLTDVAHSEKVRNLKDRVKTKVSRLAQVTERVSGVSAVSANVAVLSEPAPEAAMMMTVAMDAAVAEEPVAMKARAFPAVEEIPSAEVAPVSEEVVKRFARSAKKEFENASKLFIRLEQKVGGDAASRVTAELAEAKTLISSADEAVSSTDYSSALASYRKAATLSTKLSVFLKAFQKSRLKVLPDDSVRVEEIVKEVINLGEPLRLEREGSED